MTQKNCYFCGKIISEKFQYCFKCNQKVKKGIYKPQEEVEPSREDQILNDNYYGRGRW